MKITNRLIDFNNAAFSREDFKNAEKQNKERMVALIEKQQETQGNDLEKTQKNEK